MVRAGGKAGGINTGKYTDDVSTGNIIPGHGSSVTMETGHIYFEEGNSPYTTRIPLQDSAHGTDVGFNLVENLSFNINDILR